MNRIEKLRTEFDKARAYFVEIAEDRVLAVREDGGFTENKRRMFLVDGRVVLIFDPLEALAVEVSSGRDLLNHRDMIEAVSLALTERMLLT